MRGRRPGHRSTGCGTQDTPPDLGFDENLSGWHGGGEGYTRELSDVAFEGKKSARISGSGECGTLVRTLDAAGYRGGRLLLRGWIRAEKVEGGASLWMRIDGEKTMLAFDNMSDRCLQGTRDWTKGAIVLAVPKEAKSIVFGAMLVGKGSAWFAALELRKLDPIDPDPRPLTDRAKSNLETLAREWGVARYFHPCATEDLDLALIRSIPKVEAAKDDDVLWAAIAEMLGPLGARRPSGQGDPKIVKRTDGTILDLRGFQGDLEPHLAALVAKPIVTPAGRSVKHFGYASPGGVYAKKFERVEGRRIEPKGSEGTLVVVTDEATSPYCGRWLAALRAIGVRIVGKPVATWAGEFYDGPIAIPLASLPEVAIEPDAEGGLDEAAALLEGKELPKPKKRAVEEDLFPSPEMRGVRLASVITLWNVLRYFYPYWDVVKVDWDGAFLEHLALAATAKTPADLRRVLARMLARARDGHGSIQVTGGDPDPWTPPILVERIEGKWIVTRSETKEASVGAELTGWDRRAEELALETSAATPQWRDFRISLELLAGPKDTDTKLLLDGKEVVLKRSVFAWNLRGKRVVSKVLEGGFGYLGLDGASTKEIAAAMKMFADAPGIVFDLRGYPASDFQEIGRLIDQPAKSQHMDVPIVTRPDKPPEWQKGGWSIPARKPRYAGKAVFITDGSAVSAAETYMAIIKFNHVAPIVGEPTAGTNGNITTLRIPSGISVTFTGMRVTNMDGSAHHGAGVAPDVVAHRTVKGVREGRDELLEAALGKLKEK